MYRQLLSLGIATGVLIPNIVLAEQAIVQQGSTGATAIGNNSRSTSRVRQSATQSQNTHRNFYFNGQQTIIQQGQSTTAGVGNDNLVESQIEQDSRQNRQASYGNNTVQRSEQNAASNLEAIGNNNRINSSARQYNRQNRWK